MGQIVDHLTVKAYQELVDEWVRTHGVRYFSELTNMAVLMEEVGEVARLMARIYGDQSFKGHRKSQAELSEALADELADVLFVLTCIANQTGIDLNSSLQRNLDKKSGRDHQRHWNNPKLRT